MKMKHFALTIGLFATACTGTKKTAASDIQILKFGRGGGVTGAVTIYTLKADGSLGKEDKNQAFEKVKTLSAEQTQALFAKAEKIKDYKFNKPGNIYLFLEIGKTSGNNNIVWTMSARDLDSNVSRLHNELSAHIR